MKTPVRNLLTVAMLTIGNLSHAQNLGFQHSGNVIVDEVMYSIGGGNAVSMGWETHPACVRWVSAWAGMRT